ncbi:hypothetical protein F5141DRAFT_1079828 [Pisolithus sp. B1]|nr:hypothetical protein F5141DRAFT_1079828 [Pisolithus sp. B1]
MGGYSMLSYSLRTLSKLYILPTSIRYLYRFATSTHGKLSHRCIEPDKKTQSAHPKLSHYYIISVPLKPQPSITNLPADVPESVRKSPTFVSIHRQGSRGRSRKMSRYVPLVRENTRTVDESTIEWNTTTYQMVSLGTRILGLHHTQPRDLHSRTQKDEVFTPSDMSYSPVPPLQVNWDFLS